MENEMDNVYMTAAEAGAQDAPASDDRDRGIRAINDFIATHPAGPTVAIEQVAAQLGIEIEPDGDDA